MNKARYLEPKDRLRIAQLHVEMGDWVHSLAPWQVISHMTFSWEASIDSAQLVAARLLKPLGNAMPNSVKYYATTELLARVQEQNWLGKATNAIGQHWREKNRRKGSPFERFHDHGVDTVSEVRTS